MIQPTDLTRRLRPITRRMRPIVVAVLVTGLMAAGCSSGDGANSASSTTTTAATDPAGNSTTSTEPSDAGDSGTVSGEACDIVSDEVAARVLGIEIVRREGSGSSAEQSTGCVKGTERQADLAEGFYVSVSVYPGGSTLVDEASAEEGSKPVTGLGDRAVYVPSIGALLIADGTDAFQIQVVKAGVPGTEQDAVTVAEDVFARRG